MHNKIYSVPLGYLNQKVDYYKRQSDSVTSYVIPSQKWVIPSRHFTTYLRYKISMQEFL